MDDAGTGYDVVLNGTTTSQGGLAAPVHECVLKACTLALDMMYGPAAPPFMAWAETHAALARDGLGMLMEQAAEAFFLWRGARSETAPALLRLRRHLATAP